MKPDSRNPTWRARCDDPDTGKRVKVRLDPLGAGRTAQSRRAWALTRSREIAKRRDALSAGAPRATGTALEVAIARYYADHPRLRERTRATYAKGTDAFLAWCASQRVKNADALTLAQLVAFRSALAGAPRQRQVSGQRGARASSERVRAASAVNVHVRSIKVVLNYLRRAGLLPRLSRDDIADGLRILSTEHEAIDFLRPPEIRKLVEAARAHDAETFKTTRAEHRGLAPVGGTLRYPAITPFVLVTLLSGMRFGELLELDWSEIDLDEGEIRLGARTKTKRARTIDLSVSPTLAAVLSALGPPEDRTGRVWGLTAEQVRAAARRLARYGAPPGWSWQALRRTCGTYLTNAPGIFGAASAYRSARQLGHSVTIAERHYLGVVKVPKEATTLEGAMGVGDLKT